MIHLITLNPAIDHFIKCEHLEYGKTNYISEDYIVFGGKAVNVAHVLSSLSQKCRLVTCSDSIYSGFIKESLKEIEYHLIETDAIRINTKLNVQGEITELNSQGNSLKKYYHQFSDYVEEQVKNEDLVLIAGNPHPADYDFMIELCMKIKEKTENLLIDCSKLKLEDIQKLKPKMIKPNEEEVQALIKTEIDSKQSLLAAAEFLGLNGVDLVAITLGAKGSILYQDNQAYQSMPIKDKVINTVGAGDSYVAGIIYALANKLSTTQILTYASACGAASTFKQGLAQKADIDKYYHRVQIEKIK